jgi:hypothetical protein
MKDWKMRNLDDTVNYIYAFLLFCDSPRFSKGVVGLVSVREVQIFVDFSENIDLQYFAMRLG